MIELSSTARSAAPQSHVDAAVGRLRAEVLAREDGAFLGNETALQHLLGVSKPTVRQAARVLEAEGLLRVRRGNNGGYFGARPDPGFIEATVASYLEVLHARPQDLSRIATALWVETVRQAASLDPGLTAPLVARYRRAIARLPETAGFSEVQALEQRIREAVFELVESPYVELLFNINANFARRKLTEPPSRYDGTARHRDFVAAWRRAVTLQLDAIGNGDAEVAVLAADRVRTLLYRRIWPATPAAARP